MIRFIVSRLVGMVLVLIVVSMVTFLIFQAVPLLAKSSPVYYYIGKAPATPQLLHSLTHRFGFDETLAAYDVFEDPDASGALKVAVLRS